MSFTTKRPLHGWMQAAILVSTVTAWGACSRMDSGTQRAQENADKTDTVAHDAETDGDVSGKQPDNTAVNQRDRNDQSLTPMDQSENEADRKLTQEIRQAIVKDDSLSVNGKNVKIITVNGVVTLRGPVANEREKTSIENATKLVSGVRSVNNQLEVENRASTNY